ncbi:Uncharacterised protein [BD1-7 clade bacterium]|uniref:Glycosyltransferase RgtA/B/C/D-like domain-containing protein n=1 Tax=BD1-7 clade bacterium TaxID=2029982 RepID=A0A5S9Q951_9GAMM|nr:Uncharacterised protein [BD1-7 clade bacterium]
MRAAWQYLPLALSLVLFSVFSHFFYNQIGDDAFIYFRYVDRALAGHWGSWTSQIPAVEGYSSVLWTTWLILLAKAGIGVEVAARASGLLFALLALLSTYQLGRLLKASIWQSGVACLLFSMVAGLHYWSTAGLETSLYLLIFIQAVISMIRLRHHVLWLALIGLARPEGPILLLALLIAMKCVYRQRFPWWQVGVIVTPLLVWMAIRWQLYHALLPNTFYAKATGDPLQQIIKGLIYGFVCWIPLLGAWLLWFKSRRQDIMIALGAVSLLLGIVVGGGGDWMIYARLLVPVVPVLLAVSVALWSQSPTRNACIVVSFLPMFLLVVFPRFWWPAFTGEQLDPTSKIEGTMTERSIDLANKIDAVFGQSTRLIAVNHAGALPYALADHNVIDMVGLNDAHIARAKGHMHRKYDVDYVLEQAPDLVILNSRTLPGSQGVAYHTGYWAGETALVEHPDFYRYYQWVPAFDTRWQWQMGPPYGWFYEAAPESWIQVFVRKDLLTDPNTHLKALDDRDD